MNQTILVTGANGQVGSELRALAADYPQFEFLFADRQHLDLCNEAQTTDFMAQQPLFACINCAAYTAVDKAESDSLNAYAINVTAPALLARLCAERGVHLVHYSSDYVYNTTQNTPIHESAPLSPQGVYAKTKAEGDAAVLAANPHAIILRTAWVYSSFGQNFVKTMLRLGAERDTLNVVYDQIGTPTYARDLAQATLDILVWLAPKVLPKVGGVYHYSNSGVASWYDFARVIHRIKDIRCHINPIRSADFLTPAPRPSFSVLDKTAVQNVFGLNIRHWQDALEDCLSRID